MLRAVAFEPEPGDVTPLDGVPLASHADCDVWLRISGCEITVWAENCVVKRFQTPAPAVQAVFCSFDPARQNSLSLNDAAVAVLQQDGVVEVFAANDEHFSIAFPCAVNKLFALPTGLLAVRQSAASSSRPPAIQISSSSPSPASTKQQHASGAPVALPASLSLSSVILPAAGAPAAARIFTVSHPLRQAVAVHAADGSPLADTLRVLWTASHGGATAWPLVVTYDVANAAHAIQWLDVGVATTTPTTQATTAAAATTTTGGRLHTLHCQPINSAACAAVDVFLSGGSTIDRHDAPGALLGWVQRDRAALHTFCVRGPGAGNAAALVVEAQPLTDAPIISCCPVPCPLGSRLWLDGRHHSLLALRSDGSLQLYVARVPLIDVAWSGAAVVALRHAVGSRVTLVHSDEHSSSSSSSSSTASRASLPAACFSSLVDDTLAVVAHALHSAGAPDSLLLDLAMELASAAHRHVAHHDASVVDGDAPWAVLCALLCSDASLAPSTSTSIGTTATTVTTTTTTAPPPPTKTTTTTTTSTVASSAKNVADSDVLMGDGTDSERHGDDAWEALLASDLHTSLCSDPVLAALALPAPGGDATSAATSPSSPQPSPPTRLPGALEAALQSLADRLAPHRAAALPALHLLYESLKLNTTTCGHAARLGGLLLRLARLLGWIDYVDAYCRDGIQPRDSPPLVAAVRPAAPPPHLSTTPMGPEAPSLFAWLMRELSARHRDAAPPPVAFPTLPLGLAEQLRRVCRLYATLCHGDTTPTLATTYTPPECPLDETLLSHCITAEQRPAARVVLTLLAERLSVSWLDVLPLGVALPLREAVRQCRECPPPTGWPADAYAIIGRNELSAWPPLGRASVAAGTHSAALSLVAPGLAGDGSGAASSSPSSSSGDGGGVASDGGGLGAGGGGANDDPVDELSVYDGTELVDDVSPYRFGSDLRIAEVRRMLASAHAVPVRVRQQSGETDHDVLSNQQRRLRVISERTAALPVGRGALTLANTPSLAAALPLTDVLRVPRLMMAGRVPTSANAAAAAAAADAEGDSDDVADDPPLSTAHPFGVATAATTTTMTGASDGGNKLRAIDSDAAPRASGAAVGAVDAATAGTTTIQLEAALLPAEMLQWSEFHNGAAAGLRLGAEKQITSAWLAYARPAELSATHAGMLFALGLNGHLGVLVKNDIKCNPVVYEYLTPREREGRPHELTSIALLLGLATSRRGTMNSALAKLLSIHVPALHPPASAELETLRELPDLQVATLVAIGVLYQGTAHRRMAEVLLGEIARPPVDERRFNRESYALAAGFGLGLVALGQGDTCLGLADLRLIDRLGGYMVAADSSASRARSAAAAAAAAATGSTGGVVMGGGDPTPAGVAAAHGHGRIATETSLVLEPGGFNLDVTGPAATVALGLLFLRTNSQQAADRLAPPLNPFQLDWYAPHVLLLRATCRALVLWDSMEPSVEWLGAQIPAFLAAAAAAHQRAAQPPSLAALMSALASGGGGKAAAAAAGGDDDEGNDDPAASRTLGGASAAHAEALSDAAGADTVRQATLHLRTGACVALGLKFAGSCDERAAAVLRGEVDAILALPALADDDGLARSERLMRENCMCCVAVALAMVLAGSGDLRTLTLLRSLHRRVGPEQRFGSHMAVNLALGLLFLGGGRMTLDDSNESVAMLLLAAYPVWPTAPNDNRFHLQALRHFYVLAATPRCLETRDVDTDQPAYVPLEVCVERSTAATTTGSIATTTTTTLPLTAPCVLPPLHRIRWIRVASQRYWHREYSHAALESLWARARQRRHALTVYVKRKAGYLEYVDDPDGAKGLLSRALTRHSDLVASFAAEPVVSAFARYLCASGDGGGGGGDRVPTAGGLVVGLGRHGWPTLGNSDGNPGGGGARLQEFCSAVLYECLTQQKPEVLTAYVQLFVLMGQLGTADTAQLQQLRLVLQWYESAAMRRVTGIGAPPLVNALFVSSLRTAVDKWWRERPVRLDTVLNPSFAQSFQRYAEQGVWPSDNATATLFAAWLTLHAIPSPVVLRAMVAAVQTHSRASVPSSAASVTNLFVLDRLFCGSVPLCGLQKVAPLLAAGAT